jgi:uroporphyrinogen-III synthase
MKLAGLHILNTRPAHQSAELSAALKATGAHSREIPLIAVTTLELSATENRLLMNLDYYAGVFFVSANAARLGLNAVDNIWPQWPYKLPTFAVGERTAAVLRHAALTVHVPTQENSEGLLALPELQNVHGQKFLIFRGDGGRELLINTLRDRAASVDVIALYRRELPAAAATQWQALKQKPDIVILTSPDALRHWQTVAGAEAVAPLWLVVSPRMQALAEAAGARSITAQGADITSLLTALQHG